MPPGRKPRQFTKAEVKLLGTASDEAIGRQLGCSGQIVLQRRIALGIPAFQPRQKWTPKQLALLGQISDAELAKRFGRRVANIAARRRKLENRFVPRRKWTEDELSKLGTMFDSELAATLGCSPNTVSAKRKSLGIPRFAERQQSRWSMAEVAVLRSFADDLQVARMTGKLLNDVAAKRKAMGA